MSKNTQHNNTNAKRTRFAIYARYSSEMQNEISIDAQVDRCRAAIAERGGVLVGKPYTDSARSGWSLDRDAFIALQNDAARGKFDAVIFWKFDRLARDHNHAVMIKMLLRTEYNLKLYCVEGFSEDDDDSPYTSMMEQMLAVIAAFYSKNLSSETKKGKRQRAINGEFNGSIAPVGYELVKEAQAKPEHPAGLYIHPRQAVIIRRAFHMYATGKYSDLQIAEWMKAQRPMQKLSAKRLNINKEAVRYMLQNKIYTGRVCYAETVYIGNLSGSKRSNRHRKEWLEGKHQGFISDELFEQCQNVRKEHARYFKTSEQMRIYLLHDRVYCARCITTRPIGNVDRNFGKMRPGWSERIQAGQYRCVARDRGYHQCEQPYVSAPSIDDQVADALRKISVPKGFQNRVETAVRGRAENSDSLQLIEEIGQAIERVDFQWEKGFISPEEYVQKRSSLQKEIEALRPVDYDSLAEAFDLIHNFDVYWTQCGTLDQTLEARQQLLAKLVDKVFVYDSNVVAIALHGDFGVVLDTGEATPVEVVNSMRGVVNEKGANQKVYTQDGVDGIRTRHLRRDRATC